MTKTVKKHITHNQVQLLIMATLGVLFLLVFSYSAMFGLILAFTKGDYKIKISEAVSASFVGLENFKAFFNDMDFIDVLWNTLGLNLFSLLINFPLPIIFALLLNEVRHKYFKKCVQLVTSFPHFISWMIFGNIVLYLINMDTGIVNPILSLFGKGDVNLARAEYFWTTIIVASAIKGTGWGSIIYLTAITSIEQSLYEAAEIDGANRGQQTLYITLPGILPTITIYFLLNVSGLLGNNFEQFYSMQNTINLEKSEVLATFVYKKGLNLRRYSYATAVGFFESIVSVILLLISNFISKKLSGRGLFRE